MEAPRIVLGLGNPGPEYRSTRHNVGFRVVDRVAARRGLKLRAAGELRNRAWVAEQRDGKIVLAKPRTMMNRSGRAAVALCRAYGASSAELLVVYDDADLALGRIRLRRGGGTGGHNGVRSLVECLGASDFARVRIGVRGAGRDERDLADYVLDAFDGDEQPLVETFVDRAADAVEAVLANGLEWAMNEYNKRGLTDDSDRDGPPEAVVP